MYKLEFSINFWFRKKCNMYRNYYYGGNKKINIIEI